MPCTPAHFGWCVKGKKSCWKSHLLINGPDKRILVVSVAAAPLQMCCNPLPQWTRCPQAQKCRFAILGQNIANGNNQAGVGTGAVSANGINTGGNSGYNNAVAQNTAGRKLLAKVGK